RRAAPAEGESVRGAAGRESLEGGSPPRARGGGARLCDGARVAPARPALRASGGRGDLHARPVGRAARAPRRPGPQTAASLHAAILEIPAPPGHLQTSLALFHVEQASLQPQSAQKSTFKRERPAAGGGGCRGRRGDRARVRRRARARAAKGTTVVGWCDSDRRELA